VAYSVEVKRDLLAVPGAAIEAGVVSEPVAIAMAQGGLRPLGADIVMSCTGVAGPGSQYGIAAGTIWIACASNVSYVTEKLTISGDRNEVRAGTVTAAIELAISFLSNN
jgi:nicotinamide-nucleotide amidase